MRNIEQIKLQAERFIKDLNDNPYFKNFDFKFNGFEEEYIKVFVTRRSTDFKFHYNHQDILNGAIKAYFDTDKYFKKSDYSLGIIIGITPDDYKMNDDNLEEEMYSIFPNLKFLHQLY